MSYAAVGRVAFIAGLWIDLRSLKTCAKCGDVIEGQE